MKKALVLGAALLMFAGVASAQYSIELDLDGTTGNGPDATIEAAGPVAVDAWVNGAALLVFSANFTLSHTGPATWTPYSHATGWTVSPDQPQGGNDYLVQATDFSFTGLVPPFLHGTANYNFAGGGVVSVSVVQPNGWLDSTFLSGPFSGNVSCSFSDGISATEETSWGAVKDLFR